MEEGTFTYNYSILKESLDTEVSTVVFVKDMKKVLDDIVSGEFKNRIMRVESSDIPIHTTCKSSPQAIRFGVEITGTHGGDAEANLHRYIKPYISNESRERLIIKSGYIHCVGSNGSLHLDDSSVEPHSQRTYTYFEYNSDSWKWH